MDLRNQGATNTGQIKHVDMLAAINSPSVMLSTGTVEIFLETGRGDKAEIANGRLAGQDEAI